MLQKQECYRRAREEGNRQRVGGWRERDLMMGMPVEKFDLKP